MARNDSTSLSWLRLLQHQRSRGRTGLTIPFLIGAVGAPDQRDSSIEEDAAYGALSSLLLSFRDEVPDAHSVVIAECVDLREPIVALYPRGQARADCEGLPAGGAGIDTRLYVQRQYFLGRKHTVESVIGALWKRFRDHLMRSEFSFREGRYAPFNAEDQAFAERAVSTRVLAREEKS